MKRQKLRLGITVLFTFATVIEIAVAFLIATGLSYVFKVSLDDVSGSVLLAAFTVIVGGTTAWFVNRVLLSPVKRLSDAMDEVANGNFDIQLKSNNRIREVRNIYDKFNIMTKELRSTEILQSDFVSNVSHEIKNPITSIEGYTMLLQKEDLTEEKRKEFVEKILFNTKKLSELVGNILLLSKIDNQAIETKKRKFRLDEQIRQSLLLLEAKWIKKEIEFDVDLESVIYEGNENLLSHVWNNLIDNAVKFSPQGGLIRMRLITQGESYIFTIDDEGAGISEEYRQRVFQKFYQADNSHKQEGNGLGLALTKKIIDLYDGEIKTENLPKKGCRFTVILKNK